MKGAVIYFVDVPDGIFARVFLSELGTDTVLVGMPNGQPHELIVDPDFELVLVPTEDPSKMDMTSFLVAADDHNLGNVKVFRRESGDMGFVAYKQRGVK